MLPEAPFVPNGANTAGTAPPPPSPVRLHAPAGSPAALITSPGLAEHSHARICHGGVAGGGPLGVGDDQGGVHQPAGQPQVRPRRWCRGAFASPSGASCWHPRAVGHWPPACAARTAQGGSSVLWGAAGTQAWPRRSSPLCRRHRRRRPLVRRAPAAPCPRRDLYLCFLLKVLESYNYFRCAAGEAPLGAGGHRRCGS